jgi:hypothetical protein
VEFDGSVLAMIPIIANEAGTGDGGDAELTIVTADLVTVPVELVALMVYTVDVAGDNTLVPAIATRPIPWSILTESAPVTFHNRVDVLPESIVDGLLLNSLITEGFPAGETGSGAGDRNVLQPGIKISTSNSDRERKTNLFNLVTSKNILPAISTCP